jgi:hypothetical protein
VFVLGENENIMKAIVMDGVTFKYLNKWSDLEFWASTMEHYPPMDFDNVEIGRTVHLIADKDYTPILGNV